MILSLWSIVSIGPFETIVGVFGLSLLVLSIFSLLNQYRKQQKVSLIAFLYFIGGLALVIACFFVPSRRPETSVYSNGKDQFEWVEIIRTGDDKWQKEASEAICDLIGRYPDRYSVFDLGLAALEERKSKEAIPFLTKIERTIVEPKKKERVLRVIRMIEDQVRARKSPV